MRPYDSGLPTNDLNLQARLEYVEEGIGAATQRAGRPRSSITLVAVSKKFSAGLIREGYQAGLRNFGENYVQEFSEKSPALADLSGCRFHMIGHLQSNKANLAASLFQVIHTVDSVKLMERLDRACRDSGRQMDALIEVKLSDETAKTGAAPSQIPILLDAASRNTHLRVTGLMTMPPWSEDAERSRPYFRQLAELAAKHSLRELSMGMSNDFEVAIEEGATIIRVGTALFGPRPKPAGAEQ
ncbi:MAG TPA: YggS family pyridoxal phosphate-dependent enzyme [Bryobacteraceae bacterium]|nr:YggS family pyridoxal phosphate-dependent enzyme [Bryobacteraceae bacterium]